MNKYLRVMLFSILFLSSILLIANKRYNFFTIQGDGWSIGINTLTDLLEDDPVKNSIILDKEWLDDQTSVSTKFLADPFIFIEDSIHYIFFEHQANGNANIGLLISTNGEDFQFKGDVLDEDFHLSFPQVFKLGNDYFMLPETKQSGNVLLYKADSFPSNWSIFDTLIKNVNFKDPAILISDSINLISVSDENLKQTIYSADSLTGPWVKNELFSERYGDETRAGGNFFNVDGEWFLPLQRNNRGYGSGISLYKLKYNKREIKFEKYVESYLDKIDTLSWFNRGMHHLSVIPHQGKFKIVFDGDIKSSNKKRVANWKASLKYNFYDLKRMFVE
jgi:hypothetical protein